MGRSHGRIIVLAIALLVLMYGEAVAADVRLKIFIEKRCYTCHGIASQAEAVEKEKAAFVEAHGVEPDETEDEDDEKEKMGGDLSGVGKQRSVEWIKKFLKEPKPEFKDSADCQKKAKNKDRKKFKGSAEEFDALVSYLSGLKGDAKQAPGFASCLKE